MTALERLRSARDVLTSGVGASALLWAAALGATVLALGAVIDWVQPLSHDVRALVAPLAVAGALAAAANVWWRGRRARSLYHVALWLEERVPALRYALVTMLEQRGAPSAGLERAVASVEWRATVRRAVLRALVAPATLVAAAGVLLLTLPTGLVARVGTPRAGDTLARPGSPLRGDVNLIVPLVATVTPPAYSGIGRSVQEEPSIVAALAGSSVALEGRGPAESVRATLGDSAIRVAAEGDRWRVSLRLPIGAVALRLMDGRHARLVALEGRPDSIPRVTLLVPAHDTVLRGPKGTIVATAELSDDIGLARGWFEYIVSSGEGESFGFRSGVVARSTFAGRAATVRAVIALDSLKLVPGDIVHLRAVANDGNTLSGPGIGTSETRTIRIARAGEYDSLAVEGAAPPEVDKSALSQRMLITLAEALQRRRSRLERSAVVDASRSIAADQTRLRKRVAEVVFIRLAGDPTGEEARGSGASGERGKLSPKELLAKAEEATQAASREMLDFESGESPVVAVNRPLLEAYNAMWDAGRELESGEPGRALPHMRVALAAIQRARAAERIYLRGKPATAVVDVDKVRLAGPIAGVEPSPRTAHAPLDPAAARRRTRLDAALAQLRSTPAAAIDSLLALRIDAVGTAPALASALADAVVALRAGRDATAPLIRARRVLAGEPVARDSLPRWGTTW